MEVTSQDEKGSLLLGEGLDNSTTHLWCTCIEFIMFTLMTFCMLSHPMKSYCVHIILLHVYCFYSSCKRQQNIEQLIMSKDFYEITCCKNIVKHGLC